MRRLSGAEAAGERSVAVGGDVHGSIVTGDIVTVVHGPGRSGHRSRHPVTLDDNLKILAHRVRADLEQDQVQQKLRRGDPLPVRWRAVPEQLTGLRGRAGKTSAALGRALANSPSLDLAGALEELATVYQEERRSQLLVLGRAGSGKSVLIRRFAHARLEDPEWIGKGPLPVIFSAGSWDPHVMSLQDWLIDRLERDHPFLAKRLPYKGTWASELIVESHVLVILDGFDEMAQAHHEPAMRHLGSSNLPLLLTSRPESLGGVQPGRGLFPGIELTDLTFEDCDERFRDVTAWVPVLDRLRTRSDEPATVLASVLASPLMLTMAEAFQAGGGDPKDLLERAESGSPDELEKCLLDAFIPTTYDHILDVFVAKRRRWSAERAAHWLGFLAVHLTEQGGEAHRRAAPTSDALPSGSQDIEWWQLGTTISLPVRMLVSGALCGLVSGTAIAIVFALMNDPPVAFLAMFLNVVGIGSTFGLLHGVASKIETAGAFKPSRMQIRLRGERRETRLRRARESFLPRVGGGLAGGLVFGSVFGGGFAVYAMLHGYPWLTIALLLGNWLATGPLIGLGCGIIVALVAWLETDTKPEESVSASNLLRTNRTIAIVQAAAVGLLLGLGYGTAVTHFNGFGLGLPSGIGAAFAAAVGVGTLTAWGRWVVLVRLWLPLRRRLPWRMGAFLSDARARGVLRQAGAVHQFRHARLRDRLAETYRASEHGAEGEKP